LAVRPKWTIHLPDTGKPLTYVGSLTDQIFVANTEAHNEKRFEGAQQGHVVENRITILSGIFDAALAYITNLSVSGPFAGWEFGVRPVHLNDGVKYDCLPTNPKPCLPPKSEVDNSLALPNAMEFSSDGVTLYVAAFGSEAVGVFDADQLSQG